MMKLSLIRQKVAILLLVVFVVLVESLDMIVGTTSFIGNVNSQNVYFQTSTAAASHTATT
jgi:hypothetical protein